jgi:hypothetical protein
MPDLSFLRSEIERMRYHLQRQRKEIRALQRAGIPTKPAEELLERMQAKVDALCDERDRQRKEQSIKYPGTHRQAHQGSHRAAHPVKALSGLSDKLRRAAGRNPKTCMAFLAAPQFRGSLEI